MTTRIQSPSQFTLACISIVLLSSCKCWGPKDPRVLADGLLYEIVATNTDTLEREALGWGVCQDETESQYHQTHYWALSTKAFRPPYGLYEVEAIDDECDLGDLWTRVRRCMIGDYHFIISRCFEYDDSRQDAAEATRELLTYVRMADQSDVGSIGIWEPDDDGVDDQPGVLIREESLESRSKLEAILEALDLDDGSVTEMPKWPERCELENSYLEEWVICSYALDDKKRPYRTKFDPGVPKVWIGKTPQSIPGVRDRFPFHPGYYEPNPNYIYVFVRNEEYLVRRRD